MTKSIALGSALLALSLAPFASAASILGDIHITAQGGTATVNTGANTVTFNPAAPGTNAGVSFVTGDWTNLAINTPASYANFNYGAATTTAVAGWDANTLWFIDANSYFVLSSITEVQENGGLIVKGLGTAHHDALTPTAGLWSFSADASGQAFSFSSTTVVPPPQVPDGGVSVALLGLSLAGLAVARRKLNA
jgi:hypothetical protein